MRCRSASHPCSLVTITATSVCTRSARDVVPVNPVTSPKREFAGACAPSLCQISWAKAEALYYSTLQEPRLSPSHHTLMILDCLLHPLVLRFESILRHDFILASWPRLSAKCFCPSGSAFESTFPPSFDCSLIPQLHFIPIPSIYRQHYIHRVPVLNRFLQHHDASYVSRAGGRYQTSEIIPISTIEKNAKTIQSATHCLPTNHQTTKRNEPLPPNTGPGPPPTPSLLPQLWSCAFAFQLA
jgi:hypothetical protein